MNNELEKRLIEEEKEFNRRNEEEKKIINLEDKRDKKESIVYIKKNSKAIIKSLKELLKDIDFNKYLLNGSSKKDLIILEEELSNIDYRLRYIEEELFYFKKDKNN